MGLFKAESYQRGAVFSTALNIVAKGVIFLNTLVIAYYFGSNVSTDIYFFVLGLIVLIGTTVNGIDYLILVPETIRLRALESKESAERFINFFIYLYLLIGLCISTTVLISPTYVFGLFSKFDARALGEHYQILVVGSLVIVLHLLTSLISALLASLKYFTAPLLSGLINGLFAIAFTVAFHQTWGITGTIYGIALGYCLNFALLLVTLRRSEGWNFFNVRWISSQSTWADIGLMQVNILPVWLRNYLALYLLSGLGIGVITAVTIAQQLAGTIDILFTNQVLSVVGIKLSECNSRSAVATAGEIFAATAKSLLILIIPGVVVVSFYAHEIVQVFLSIRPLDPDVAANIELCLKYLILLAPFTMINSLCTRLFAAFQKLRRTVWPSLITHILFLVLTVLLTTIFGLPGFLYSQIGGFVLLLALFFVIVKREFPLIEFADVVRFAIMQTVVNLLILFAVAKLSILLELHLAISLLAAVSLQYSIALGLNFRSPLVQKFGESINVFTNKTRS
ncbi:MAG: hypothetical protein LC734_09320 [Acidobacteria bacterium]|nr:hypothetical protein [Acidobacteriota bacterium]